MKEIVMDLVSGYERFRQGYWRDERARWDNLSQGQSPRTMIISCSDSRVEPSLIFDTHPGELFIVRNVAALVPPFVNDGGQHGVSAALEFAVRFLEVNLVMVMGHGLCGGCQAALSGSMQGKKLGEGGFVANWIDLLDDARDIVLHTYGEDAVKDKAALSAMEHEAVKVSLSNLATFPFVKERVEKGILKLQGAWFAVSSGELHLFDENTQKFNPVPILGGSDA